MGYQDLVGPGSGRHHPRVAAPAAPESPVLPPSAELLESTTDCVFLLDSSWRFTYLNARAEQEIAGGRSLIGRTLWTEFPEAAGTLFETRYRQAMEERVGVSFETYFPPLASWFKVFARPLSIGGIGVWFQNITAPKEREAQLSNIFSQALVGVMLCGPDGRAQMVNDRFCEILGRSADELKSLDVSDYTHPDDLGWNLPLLEKHLRSGDSLRLEKRYLRPDGSSAWCKVSVSFVAGAAGEVEASIVVAQETTQHKQAERALEEGEQLYRSILDASADCIKILDLDGRLVLMNSPGVCGLELPCFEQIRGMPWVNLWPPQSRAVVEAAVADATAGKIARFSAACPTAKGASKWWNVVVTPMRDRDGEVARLLSISRDVTIERASAEQLQWTSEHDALTELPNRGAFEAHLQGATIRAMQRGNKVGLLLLDLDHFKHVNDTLGHPAGDHLLTIFAMRLKECVRESDFVARLGGDEFAVVFESQVTELNILDTGQAILARLQEPIPYEGRMISAGASIGGAVFPNDASSAQELLKNADIALYALKEAGRGGTKMFHQHMRQEAQLVASQLSLARTAISTRSVEPHYQQKVDLCTGRIVGFEALLRWRHSARGIQPPDTVAEAFKDYELATKIGDLMQCGVFRDVRRWLDASLPIGSVAINAAPAEFLRDDFAERFLARMHEHGIPPCIVELEVTEHVFIERGSDYVGRALKLLAAEGVRIALDDFGTGYSSLSHLRDYPVHVVKIDQSFVDLIGMEPEIRAIVCAVIDLAKSLNIAVVAEGIETPEQRALLVKDGCQLGQGYLFGRAIQAGQVAALIAPPPLILSSSDVRMGRTPPVC
jgi:diguanylate cyclase (GGDEF)-like protein/PAS domain S-box-containing protein